jgi:hypothetical protein
MFRLERVCGTLGKLDWEASGAVSAKEPLAPGRVVGARVKSYLAAHPLPLGSGIRQKRMPPKLRTNMVQSRRLPPADRGEVTLPAGAQAHG